MRAPLIGANMNHEQQHSLEDLGGFSVNAFCAWAGIGRTAAYSEIKEGRLSVRKFGKRTIVPIAEARRWFEALPNLRRAERH
jgi:hypothetical protein